jgi:hypothetical protein
MTEPLPLLIETCVQIAWDYLDRSCALCASSDAGHDAVMTMYRLRFMEQIDLVPAVQLRDLWRPEREIGTIGLDPVFSNNTPAGEHDG